MTTSTFRSQYEPLARAAARRYGIDEELFVRLITAESGWNPGAVSSAGAIGLGQLMPGTAADLGVKNPYDPQQNLDGAAKYLAQLLKAFRGNTQMAVAGYVAGPGKVQKAVAEAALAGDTRKWFERYMESLGQDAAGVSQYLSSILTPRADATRPGGTRGYAEPTLEDFPIVDEFGQPTGQYDVQAFNRARREWEEFTKGQDNLAEYLDNVIQTLGLEIEAGALNVSKANSEFRRRLDAFQAAGGQLTNLLGYALPADAKYVPGREPGGFYEKMGLPPVPASGMIYNPFAMAMEIVNTTPNLTTIPTPGYSGGGSLFAQALSIAQGAGAGASGSAPPPPPPPPPTLPQTSIAPGMASTAEGDAEAIRLAQMFTGGSW
ncbi:MAG TPA: lytic transglycosylase domain-containing protein [Vicinamibacterales bacterium]|nr:lytic transglycosylase domain-containing protein [Vicinamibacterales bacterium]